MPRLGLVISLALVFSSAPEAYSQNSRLPDDPRIADFFPDLGRNSVGLFSSENLLPLVVGASATAASHSIDNRVHAYFGPVDRLGPLEAAGNNGGRALFVASTVGGLLVVGQVQSNDRFRRFTYDLAQATALTGLITTGMKVAVHRPRPVGNSQVSFPSGHTSSAFAIATVTAEHFGLWAAIPGYLGASLVAVSRLDSEKHYLSDVVAGATLGYIVAQSAVRTGAEPQRSVNWAPIVSPATQTVGLGVRWNFSP